MTSSLQWAVEFYETARGDKPVEDFISALDEKTQLKLLTKIKYLEATNQRARAPHVKQIRGKLWELRAETNSGLYRIFYAFVPVRRIILLHAFQKDEQKTPEKEIEIALNRLNRYQVR